jgi:hypothetical protein
MLACDDSYCLALSTCESKAVQLYDDAEVRDSIVRTFGEVSRGQFEFMCAEAYKHRAHLVRKVIVLPQQSIEEIYGEKGWV